MTYPAVNDPNITSGFTFNKRSVSLASELRSFVGLRRSRAHRPQLVTILYAYACGASEYQSVGMLCFDVFMLQASACTVPGENQPLWNARNNVVAESTQRSEKYFEIFMGKGATVFPLALKAYA